MFAILHICDEDDLLPHQLRLTAESYLTVSCRPSLSFIAFVWFSRLQVVSLQS